MRIQDYFNVATIIVLLGVLAFSTNNNRKLRQENEVLSEASAMLLKENEKLSKQVAERDTVIKQSTLVYDSLKITLEDLNKNIVPKYAPFSVVDRLDLGGQIQLLTDYISQADSLRN